MAPRDPRSAPRTPQAPASGGGRPHHLASVVHHFLSDTPAPAREKGALPVIVAGHGRPDPTAGVRERLAGCDVGRPIVEVGGSRSAALTAGENSAGFPGSVPSAGGDLVWCVGAGAAGSLLAIRELGRWVRLVRPESLEIIVGGGVAGEAPPDLGRLRRQVDLVAPGVPARITQVEGGRLDSAIPALAARLRPRSPERTE